MVAAGVDGGGGAGGAGVDGGVLFLFYFLKKKFTKCFFCTRQRLCRVSDKKHSANKRLPLKGLPSVFGSSPSAPGTRQSS